MVVNDFPVLAKRVLKCLELEKGIEMQGLRTLVNTMVQFGTYLTPPTEEMSTCERVLKYCQEHNGGATVGNPTYDFVIRFANAWIQCMSDQGGIDAFVKGWDGAGAQTPGGSCWVAGARWVVLKMVGAKSIPRGKKTVNEFEQAVKDENDDIDGCKIFLY